MALLCGKIMADGSRCTRYRGYSKGLVTDLPHEGACDAGERIAPSRTQPVDLPLVYLDTETGGIAFSCSTIQVAVALPVWSRLDDGDPDSFDSFMRPTFGPLLVEPEAMAYNGIDLRNAVQWPKQTDVAYNLQAWVAERFAEGVKLVACGFNVRFDVNRLDLFCPGMFSHRVLDLTAVALFHGIPSKSIELIKRFGDPDRHTVRHDALADACQARAVHMSMMQYLSAGDPTIYPVKNLPA